ncbi:MAG: NosR/NirI family protein [Rhodobacteraceae bacterium]|nr:NosR/NirI family protein [Paracoccaceae bacterium]
MLLISNPHRRLLSLLKLISLAGLILVLLASTLLANTPSFLGKYLEKVPASELVEGATGYGNTLGNIPAVEVLSGQNLVGYAYITSDFVNTTGYSGKPIHVLVAIGPDALILGANLVKHSEPIVLIGIPDSKMKAMTESYRGMNIAAEIEARGSTHELDIISGATVTVMIIDDTIVRASIKVARALGLGGLEATVDIGPVRSLNMNERSRRDWMALTGDGSVRSLTLDVSQINEAFAETGDPRVLRNPAKGAPEDTFIDLKTALISVPGIGLSLLGENEYNNLLEWMDEGGSAIAVFGRGQYSFKGSGYVRGGIFDRIHLLQDDASVRFRDREHKRLRVIAADGAPGFTELDLFKIPADSGFDPTRPWQLQLLVSRAVGPIEKTFLTFDLGYQTPEFYLETIEAAPETVSNAIDEDSDSAARAELWKRIWQSKKLEIGLLVGMLTVLTGVFFFQFQATRHARAFYWFRMGFLALTLGFLGFSQNAQLSVVNLMALGASLQNGFSWDAFLMDPLVFILWVSVAVTILFWGRGGYCGWLCPFGALQELTNQIARFFKVPQWTLPWGLHERLWPLKYMIFLGLFGLSLASMTLAETYAEVEPFKTSIILKFAREWPFVLYATVLLGIGLFIERFYCRYLCPLGAALAIPGRLRMFNWLKRYKECGSPCQTCANECFVQAIHPTGEINPNECLSCLHCQVLYQDHAKCPVVIKKDKRRAKMAQSASNSALDRLTNHPNVQTKEKANG